VQRVGGLAFIVIIMIGCIASYVYVLLGAVVVAGSVHLDQAAQHQLLDRLGG
jgi:hypothetical protein